MLLGDELSGHLIDGQYDGQTPGLIAKISPNTFDNTMQL